jgi:hypothetical protein
MRTTFVLTETKSLQSAIRPRVEPHAISAGTKVVLTAPFETPYGAVPAGAKGFVESVDAEDGTLWVLMEGMEPALVRWDNMLVLSPFTCEELAVCTRLSTDKMPSRTVVLRACHSTARLIAASLLAFVIGWAVDPPLGAQARVVLSALSSALEAYY